MKNASVALLLLAAFAIPASADHHHKPLALIGVWDAEASTDQGSREIEWTFSKKDGKVVGSSLTKETNERRKLDRVKVKGKSLVLEIEIEQDGNSGIIRVEAEEKSPGKLVGEWSIVGDDGTQYMDGKITAVKQVAYAGTWDAKSTLPDGETMTFAMHLEGDNAKLKGHFEGDGGETKIDSISTKEDALRLEFEVDYNGNMMDIEIAAKPKGENKLVGKWKAMGDDGNEVAEGEWEATRKPKSLAGNWNFVAVVPDGGEYEGTLTLDAADGKYTGTSKLANNDANDLESIKVSDAGLEFSFEFSQGDTEGTITVEAELQDDGSLKGDWTLTGKNGDKMASESWTASRK